MIIGPNSFVRLEKEDRQVRLSYVCEDDGGCLKGLTVARLLPGPAPTSYDGDLIVPGRPAVYVGAKKVGIFDQYFGQWDASFRDSQEAAEPRVLSGGALTCTFSLLDGIEAPSFLEAADTRIAKVSDSEIEVAHVLGGGAIGTILDVVGHLRWGEKCIYPLLRLQRSRLDIEKGNLSKRNGAMITTNSGALVGVIVGISENGQSYVVAPIQDIMTWHKLHILGPADPAAEPVPAVEPRNHSDRKLLDCLDVRMGELVAA